MIEPLSLLTVVGLGIYLTILIVQWWSKINDKRQKAKDEEDNEIDKANNADDLLRQLDKLRDK